MKHIKSYYEYLVQLSQLIHDHGDKEIDSDSINAFIDDYNLKNDYGIEYNDVKIDIRDMSKKYTKKTNKKYIIVQDYDQYINLLTNALTQNNSNYLDDQQIESFLEYYNLENDWGITKKDLYDDMESILHGSNSRRLIQNGHISNDSFKSISNTNVDYHDELSDQIKIFKDDRLNNIVNEYYENITDYKKMKAILMDYYPNEKLKRNLILACIEENIVYELIKQKKCPKFDFIRYRKRIVESYGCSSEKANEIISLWITSLGINVSEYN